MHHFLIMCSTRLIIFSLSATPRLVNWNCTIDQKLSLEIKTLRTMHPKFKLLPDLKKAVRKTRGIMGTQFKAFLKTLKSSQPYRIISLNCVPIMPRDAMVSQTGVVIFSSLTGKLPILFF